MSLIMADNPHLLSGVRNLAEPDVAAVAARLRSRVAEEDPVRLRQQAPQTVSRAAEWVLEHSQEIADIVMSGSTVGFSRAMLLEAFDNTLRRWLDADRLKAFVREESHAPNNAQVVYPQVVFLNLAGNLFVSGWEAMTHAALLGAASVVRCSEADRTFAGIWAMALAKFSPIGGDMAVVCEWDRQDRERFRAAAEAADAVVAFGGDEAVRAVREVVPWNRPFVGHGSAVSFSILTGEELRHSAVEVLAEQCAYDFAVYDQQGCLSPRAIFLEDAHSRDVDRFVDALHDALVKWEKQLPRRTLSLEDSAALARARDGVLLDAACGGPARRVSCDADPFLVTVKPTSYFSLGPVNRYADVYLYNDLDEVEAALLPMQGQISTLGVAHPGRSVSELVSALRVARVCEVGSMQRPGIAWYLDGYRPLQSLLRFRTLQAG